VLLFFFSSRRRHTRSKRDWSSDVCSSDLLGSLVSRVEDVQQLILPMTFLIMIAFFIAMFGLNMPESKLVVISSYIPFFSPMLMFLRVGMVDVPVWEVALSIGILV